MQSYTNNSPTFNNSISVVESTDPASAGLINTADKQNFENTVYLKNSIDAHENIDVSGENGIHGLRFYNNKLQADVDGTWTDTSEEYDAGNGVTISNNEISIDSTVTSHPSASVRTTDGVHDVRVNDNKLQWKDSNGNWNNTFSVLDAYPIGSIYISTSNINPGNIFGGTWQSFGAGRTLVGVDVNDSNFNTVSKTGGSKYMQSHSHAFYGSQISHRHTIDGDQIVSAVCNVIEPRLYIYNDTTYNTTGSGIRLGDKSNVSSFSSNRYSEMFAAGSASNVTTDSESFYCDGSIGYAGSGSSENLQPYITTYFWKRTA